MCHQNNCLVRIQEPAATYILVPLTLRSFPSLAHPTNLLSHYRNCCLRDLCSLSLQFNFSQLSPCSLPSSLDNPSQWWMWFDLYTLEAAQLHVSPPQQNLSSRHYTLPAMKNVNHVTGKMEVVTSVFPRITSIKANYNLNPDVLEAGTAWAKLLVSPSL